MTKKIELTRGLHAIVDDDDYDWLNQHSWSAQKDERGKIYAATTILGELCYMHRLILEDECDDERVDHKNGDTLDNCRDNLRVVSVSENAMNNDKTKEPRSSKYKGVTRLNGKRWKAHIGYDNKDIHLGYFPTEEKAARAYDSRAKEIFGEHAKLNFPD